MSAPYRSSPRLGEPLFQAALVLFLAAIVLVPAGRILIEAFAPRGIPGFAVLGRVMGDPATWIAFTHTVEVSAGGMLISALLGAAAAILVTLTDLPMKRLLVFAFTLLLMVPSQVTTIAWIELLGPSSALLGPLGLAPAPGSPHPLYSGWGITVLLGIEHAPLVFLGLRVALRRLPGDLIEAARASGASPLQVLVSIVMPLMAPGWIAGTALAFVSNIGNFGTPALLGIPGRFPTLTTLIYQRLSGFGPKVLGEVAALSLLLGGLAVLGILTEHWLTGRREARFDGLAAGQFPLPLGFWRVPFATLCWLFLAATLLVPLAALVTTALVSAYGQVLSADTLTLANFRFVLMEHPAVHRALANSLMLATAAAAGLGLLSVPVGYFAVWRRRPAIGTLVLGAELPYALPGVVLAIACILVFIRPIFGISLYNTLGIILVAYLARFFTLAHRPVAASFRQLDPKVEEAAQMAGAGFLRRLVTVILPLTAPAALAGAFLVFLTAFNELTVSALLWSAGHETLGVVVFSLEQAGDNVSAAAVACVSVAATILLMAIASFLTRRSNSNILPWHA